LVRPVRETAASAVPAFAVFDLPFLFRDAGAHYHDTCGTPLELRIEELTEIRLVQRLEAATIERAVQRQMPSSIGSRVSAIPAW
jgi:TRAP-type C4-dicarboxylate transport system substrate-binding protein